MTATEQLDRLKRYLDATVSDALGALRSEQEQAEQLADGLNAEIESLKLTVEQLEHERDEAVRHEGMFRRALFTYLQEREGPAGRNAPTPETLDWIKRLVDG